MTTQPDNKALTKWEKSDISYKNYQAFIHRKSKRFKLTLIDLLYVSNFKGGNSTINEQETEIDNKLTAYSEKLIAIDSRFNGKSLGKLSENEINELIDLITSTCDLTHKTESTKIDGFSASYLSALLSAYFPDLIPILDRRVLINLKLVKKSDIDNYGQVKNIQQFYERLVRKIANYPGIEKLTIREIDKELFTKRIEPKDYFGDTIKLG